MKAYHFAESFIRDGIPIWWDESDDVRFEAEGRISRARAAVERAQKRESDKNKEPVPGRYFIPVPKPLGGGGFPSFADWIEEQERKKGLKKG